MKVKLTNQELVYLYDCHVWKEQTGTGPYYKLLQEHCIDFCRYFDHLLTRGSKTYNVKFSSLQALAFMQLWQDQPLPAAGWWVINKMIGIFDQVSKQPKPIHNENS